MEGSLALLLFAAFFRFVDPGERNAHKERPGPGGRGLYTGSPVHGVHLQPGQVYTAMAESLRENPGREAVRRSV